MDDLSPCPFCGQSDTVEPIEASRMFADMDVEVGDEHQESFAVVCSVWNEGCGASSGFMLTREQAAQRWNRRAPSAGDGQGGFAEAPLAGFLSQLLDQANDHNGGEPR